MQWCEWVADGDFSKSMTIRENGNRAASSNFGGDHGRMKMDVRSTRVKPMSECGRLRSLFIGEV